MTKFNKSEIIERQTNYWGAKDPKPYVKEMAHYGKIITGDLLDEATPASYRNRYRQNQGRSDLFNPHKPLLECKVEQRTLEQPVIWHEIIYTYPDALGFTLAKAVAVPYTYYERHTGMLPTHVTEPIKNAVSAVTDILFNQLEESIKAQKNPISLTPVMRDLINDTMELSLISKGSSSTLTANKAEPLNPQAVIKYTPNLRGAPHRCSCSIVYHDKYYCDNDQYFTEIEWGRGEKEIECTVSVSSPEVIAAQGREVPLFWMSARRMKLEGSERFYGVESSQPLYNKEAHTGLKGFSGWVAAFIIVLLFFSFNLFRFRKK